MKVVPPVGLDQVVDAILRIVDEIDQSSLDLMDRLIGAYLTELAPVIIASSSGISQVSSAQYVIAGAPTRSLPTNVTSPGLPLPLSNLFLSQRETPNEIW